MVLQPVKIREIPDLDNVIITFLTARNEDYSEIENGNR